MLATGVTITIREVLEHSAAALALELNWHGQDENEVATERGTGRTLIRVNPKYFRPAEVDLLIGDVSKARAKLGSTTKVAIDDLAADMAQSDHDHYLKV